MATNIPAHVTALRDDSPEAFKEQQERIRKWVSEQKRIAEAAARNQRKNN